MGSLETFPGAQAREHGPDMVRTARIEQTLGAGWQLHFEEPQRADEIAARCERRARALGCHRSVGRSLVLAAAVAMRRGDLARTFELVADAERETEQSGDAPDLRAEIAVTQSRLSFFAGAYHDALEQADEAVALADEHGLRRLRLQARHARNLVVGTIERVQLEASVRELLTLAIELDEPHDEAIARNDLAWAIFCRGDLEGAGDEVERSIALARSLGRHGNLPLAYALGTRAEILLESGDAPAAIAELDESLAVADAEQEPEPYLTGVTLLVKSQALVATGRLDEALDTARGGLDLLGERLPHVRAQLLGQIASTLREAGRFDKAYGALEESAALERSAAQDLAARQLALQRASLEARATRREAEVLAAKNRELQELVDELNGAHAELGRRMSQLEALRDRLREQADHDWLTGLKNRRFFARRFPRVVAEVADAGTVLSIAVVDLDHFKSVNDRFGHATGDRVLKAAARLLTRAIRETDVVVRTGGEEFVIVMPGIGIDEAMGCCERLRAELQSGGWLQRGPLTGLTLSAGVASTEEGISPSALMTVADRRLYAAKSAGRNRVIGGDSAEPASLASVVL